MTLNLEHTGPGGDAQPAGDIYSRLAASLKQIEDESERDFDLPLAGLVARYHRRVELEEYREAMDADEEWERWAQLLIDSCIGFRDVSQPDLLVDDHGQPVQWDTLALKLGIDPDPEFGVRGLVLSLFAGVQADLANHAQRVDAWITQERRADQARAAGGQ